MNTIGMLTDLRREHEQLGQIIMLVERYASGSGGKRRGRPPKWMTNAKRGVDPADSAGGVKHRQRKPFTAETRRKMAASQKRRWAAKHKEKTAGAGA